MYEHSRNGGSAFPAVVPIEHSHQQGKDYPNYAETGMTLRDYIAAHVLQGLVAFGPGRCGPESVAILAYRYADAMLTAREQARA